MALEPLPDGPVPAQRVRRGGRVAGPGRGGGDHGHRQQVVLQLLETLPVEPEDVLPAVHLDERGQVRIAHQLGQGAAGAGGGGGALHPAGVADEDPHQGQASPDVLFGQRQRLAGAVDQPGETQLVEQARGSARIMGAQRVAEAAEHAPEHQVETGHPRRFADRPQVAGAAGHRRVVQPGEAGEVLGRG